MMPPWLRASLKLEQRAAQIIRWPCLNWQRDPVGFSQTILGHDPYDKQAEILLALTVTNDDGYPCAKVAVRSGNGLGKTDLAAVAGLWWQSLWSDAQVICSAPVLRQVEDLIWRQVLQLHGASGVCLRCRQDGFPGRQCDHSTRLDGVPARTPEKGLQVGLRKLKGFVAVDAQRAVGYFGPHQLWIGDEAAALRDDWQEAAQSACKGGGSILSIGNPSEQTGFFARAFLPEGKPRDGDWWTARFTLSAFDCPNVKQNRIVIPGLVTADWVESCRILWGEGSDLWKIRVLGIHPTHVRGMLLSYGEIDLMHARWAPIPLRGTMPDRGALPDSPDGLAIGLDVAAFGRTEGKHMISGSSGIAGDKWVATVLRGMYVCDQVKWPTMTRDELVQRLVDLRRKWSKYDGEPVTLRFDAEGANGSECGDFLYAVQTAPGNLLADWQIDGVKASWRMRPEEVYGTVRDAMYANLAEWVRAGGMVPPDPELDDELVHTSWRPDPHGGKERILEKEKIKDQLPHGRSPDTAESLALAAWTGQVIGETAREREGGEGIPLWMQGQDKTPSARESRMAKYGERFMRGRKR